MTSDTTEAARSLISRALLPRAPQMQPILHADGLHLSYHGASGPTQVLRGVTLTVEPGESVGLVGESGSGKSTFARAALGLLSSARIDSGTLWVEGQEVTRFNDSSWEHIRGNPIAIVFQDPLSYLNPVRRLGFQIAEAIGRHDPTAKVSARVDELLGLVQLPRTAFHAFPHELSGGMRQRGLLAIALACRPRLLIADEPTTALDVTTQAEILKLLRELRSRLKMALLLISHDLAVVSAVCDQLYVMYAGRIVEHGRTDSVFKEPAHPYSQGLIQSARLARVSGGRYASVPGDVPNPGEVHRGCPFAPRCTFVFERCVDLPPLLIAPSGQEARCWLLDRSPA